MTDFREQLKNVTIALEQAVAAGDLGAIASGVADLGRLRCAGNVPDLHYSSMDDPDIIVKMGEENDSWQRDYKRLDDGRWLSLHFDAGGFLVRVLPDFDAVAADIARARLTDGTLITFLKEHEARLRDLFDISDEDLNLYFVEGDDYFFSPFFQRFQFPFELTKEHDEEED